MGQSMMSRWDGVEDNKLLQAIYRVTFDHGKTNIGIGAEVSGTEE